MRYSELKCKDVINLRDCRKLGRIGDLEFDECSGRICSVTVPGNNKSVSYTHLDSYEGQGYCPHRYW